MHPRLLTVAATLLLAMGLMGPAVAEHEEGAGEHSDTMSHVANLPYEVAWPDKRDPGTHLPYGTDIEFASLEVPGAVGTAVTRLRGGERIATAVAVSAGTFDRADTVVIATAGDYADALAGSPLAVHEGAPLLLSATASLSAPTAAEVERLGAKRAILLGGTAALSAQVEQELRDAGLETTRVWGSNRFSTAARIKEALPASDRVYVTEGAHADRSRGWPDALSAAGLAAAPGTPILLVVADRLPSETAEALGSELDVTIVGGSAAVSNEVAAAIDVRARTVDRIFGANRYETSRKAAEAAIARGADPARTFVATGRNFPDGLVAGAAAGFVDGVLVLVDGQAVERSPSTLTFLEQQADAIRELFLVGGRAAISEETEARLRRAVGASTTAPTGEADGGGTQDPLADPTSGSDNQVLVPEGSTGETTAGQPRMRTRDFAIAGTYYNGLQIIDITDPTAPEIASVWDCGTLQGDVQIFEQGGRTLATFTSEDTSGLIVESRCVQDNVAMGNIVLEDLNGDGEITTYAEKLPAYGTYVADITDPYNPTTAGFIPVPEGSHNNTIHPSGNYFYNSNSALIMGTGALPNTSPPPFIEVYDISDLGNVRRVADLPLPVRPGLGTNSHDITFNADGTRAYSAALSQTVIINTEDPANPSVISSFIDPTINVEHQSDPITMTTSTGERRDLLIVQDELAGAAGNGFCPGGGLHVYDITGENELSPQSHKVGVFFIPDFRPAGTGSGQGESVVCTSHVYRLYPEQGIMTIAWYNAGSWVVDISGLADLAVTPVSQPMQAVGHYYFPDSDTWSFKTNAFEEDGSFYGFANDIVRGLDVFRYEPAATATASAAGAEMAGVWLTPAEAEARALANPAPPLGPDNPLLCLIGVPDQY